TLCTRCRCTVRSDAFSATANVAWLMERANRRDCRFRTASHVTLGLRVCTSMNMSANRPNPCRVARSFEKSLLLRKKGKTCFNFEDDALPARSATTTRNQAVEIPSEMTRPSPNPEKLGNITTTRCNTGPEPCYFVTFLAIL